MIDTLQLIAMYVVTLFAVAVCPRLLFVVMCLVAGYPVMAMLALIATFVAMCCS